MFPLFANSNSAEKRIMPIVAPAAGPIPTSEIGLNNNSTLSKDEFSTIPKDYSSIQPSDVNFELISKINIDPRPASINTSTFSESITHADEDEKDEFVSAEDMEVLLRLKLKHLEQIREVQATRIALTELQM